MNFFRRLFSTRPASAPADYQDFIQKGRSIIRFARITELDRIEDLYLIHKKPVPRMLKNYLDDRRAQLLSEAKG